MTGTHVSISPFSNPMNVYNLINVGYPYPYIGQSDHRHSCLYKLRDTWNATHRQYTESNFTPINNLHLQSCISIPHRGIDPFQPKDVENILFAFWDKQFWVMPACPDSANQHISTCQMGSKSWQSSAIKLHLPLYSRFSKSHFVLASYSLFDFCPEAKIPFKHSWPGPDAGFIHHWWMQNRCLPANDCRPICVRSCKN